MIFDTMIGLEDFLAFFDQTTSDPLKEFYTHFCSVHFCNSEPLRQTILGKSKNWEIKIVYEIWERLFLQYVWSKSHWNQTKLGQHGEQESHVTYT